MRFIFPKNDKKFLWTSHIKNKMLYYGLSEQRVRRVLKSPKRIEKGIAPDTSAAMQSSATRKNPEEIWVMYSVSDGSGSAGQTSAVKSGKAALGKTKKPIGKRIIMISAWRYPGITTPGTPIPVPDDMREELANKFKM